MSNTKVYAAYVIEKYIRYNSSSGGIFSLLAKDVIDKKGIVYGASFEILEDAVYRRNRQI